MRHATPDPWRSVIGICTGASEAAIRAALQRALPDKTFGLTKVEASNSWRISLDPREWSGPKRSIEDAVNNVQYGKDAVRQALHDADIHFSE